MALAIVTATPGQVEAIPADRCRVGSDVRDTELAIKAYWEGEITVPGRRSDCPAGLRVNHPSEENNKVFGPNAIFRCRFCRQCQVGW